MKVFFVLLIVLILFGAAFATQYVQDLNYIQTLHAIGTAFNKPSSPMLLNIFLELRQYVGK